jgi:hypothetical protein
MNVTLSCRHVERDMNIERRRGNGVWGPVEKKEEQQKGF